MHKTPSEGRRTHVLNAPLVTFRDLSRKESEQLLSRHHVGRMAFTFHDKVDIEPIHYVYSDGAIFARTTYGRKLTVLAHHPWVAFEVDEVNGPFDWRSVVVKGTVYVVEEDLAPHSREQFEHARDVIRQAMPMAFTSEDPVPDRSIVLRIHVDEIVGRAAESDEPLSPVWHRR